MLKPFWYTEITTRGATVLLTHYFVLSHKFCARIEMEVANLDKIN